jgi:prevent-host-death family protein
MSGVAHCEPTKERDMREQEPTTQTMKITDVKSKLSSLVDEVSRKETRVLVEKAGHPVAAFVSVDDLKRLIELDEQDRRARDVLEAMRAPFRGVPPEEIEREAERAIAQVRAERRAARTRAREAAASV